LIFGDTDETSRNTGPTQSSSPRIRVEGDDTAGPHNHAAFVGVLFVRAFAFGGGKQKPVPEGYALTHGVSDLSAASGTEERRHGRIEKVRGAMHTLPERAVEPPFGRLGKSR